MSEHRPQLQWSMGAAGPVLAAEDDADWRDLARCSEIDGDLFFPEKGGSTRDAKKVCFACEVRAECLTYALEHDERFGIWGGLSERERRSLRRREDQRAELLAAGEKSCSRCGDSKPLDEFPTAAWGAGWASWCRECTNATRRKAAA